MAQYAAPGGRQGVRLDLAVLFFVSGSFGEPSFVHPLALFDQLEDGPKAAEAHYAEQYAPHAGGEQRACNAPQSHQQEYPPRACAQVVLGLDDQRMEDADGEESGCADKYTGEVHAVRR